jgi:radical SAM protein with 4Fe4S-binding SPASM domain
MRYGEQMVNQSGNPSIYSLSNEKNISKFIESNEPEEILPFMRKHSRLWFDTRCSEEPLGLTIEITNRCPYNCIMCAVHEMDTIKPSFMSVGDFEHILNSALSSGNRFESLKIFWIGEPSFHPDFKEILRISSEALGRVSPRTELCFDTNMSNVGEGVARQIIQSSSMVPMRIIASMDAIIASTYGRIRRGGRFEAVMKNLERLFELREAAHQKSPRIAIQFIVMKENAAEAKQFKEHWDSYFAKKGIQMNYMVDKGSAEADGLTFRRLTEQKHPHGELQNEANKLFDDTMSLLGINSPPQVCEKSQVKRGVCGDIFKFPFVRVDGSLTICNKDLIQMFKLGNLLETDFNTLWNSDTLLRWRMAHITGKHQILPKVCQECEPHHCLSGLQIASYLNLFNLDINKGGI